MWARCRRLAVCLLFLWWVFFARWVFARCAREGAGRVGGVEGAAAGAGDAAGG